MFRCLFVTALAVVMAGCGGSSGGGVKPTEKWQREAVKWILQYANDPKQVEIVSFGTRPDFEGKTKPPMPPQPAADLPKQASGIEDINFSVEGPEFDGTYVDAQVSYRDVTPFGGKTIYVAWMTFDRDQNLIKAHTTP